MVYGDETNVNAFYHLSPPEIVAMLTCFICLEMLFLAISIASIEQMAINI